MFRFLRFVVIANILVALGVDSDGKKHPLGIREGNTENAAVVKGLLADLVERGLPTDRELVFVIDGSKALRQAIEKAFGAMALIQGCPVHYVERRIMPSWGHEPLWGRDLALMYSA